MPAVRERPPSEPRESRRPIRPAQPASTAGLRPSQRRAAEHRASFERSRAAEHWLRRLARL